MSEEKEIVNANGDTEVDTTSTQSDEQTSFKDELRRFMYGVTESSVRAQGISYSSVAKTIDRADDSVKEILKSATKPVVKLTVSTALQRYGHAKSFQNVARLLDALAKHDYVSTVRTLAQTIISAFPILPNISSPLSLIAVPSSKWLLHLLQSSSSSSLSAEDNLLITSALATLAYYTSVSKKASAIFSKKLERSLRSDARLKQAIESTIAEIAKENGEKAVCLISTEAFAVPLFIETFTKVVLLPKVRPSQNVVDACKPSLAQLTEKDFADAFLPNIKKAMLRSPEVAMHGVLATVEAFPFSLDAHADEILKAALGSAQSADDSLRDAAIGVAVALSARAQAPVLAKVVARLFDQVSGAKSSEHRIALLQGIAKIAKLAPKNLDVAAVDKIADDVISKTAKGDKDTHEATVSAQWATAVEWAQRLSKVTPTLVNAFKEASKLAPTVRNVGYRTLVEVMEKKNLTALPDGVNAKDFWAEVETGPKGELSSVPLALLLLNVAKEGSVEHTKVWSRAAHAESLFKEKHLSSVRWQDALIWCKLVENIITQRPVGDKNAPATYSSVFLKSFSLLLFWPNWKVREQASKSLEKVLEKEKAIFAEALADTIYTETVNGNIDSLLRKVPACPEATEWTVPGEWYVKTLRLLLTPNGPELDKLAIHTLLLASVQRLVEVDGSVWLRWMHSHREAKTWEDSESFRESAIMRVLRCRERPVRDTALITLVALNVESVRNHLWKHVEESIADLDVKTYTKLTEKQIAVYKCPEGQLYNTDALDFDEGEGMHNMKRENKAYSYKDQLAEIQLKRELAEKRKKEGKLTPKQKQVMEKELASEKVVRDELKELYNVAEEKLDELRALVAADHAGAFARPTLLFDHCLPLTKSLLIAKEAAAVFLAYRHAAFEHTDDYLDELVASCWLRVIGAQWQIDSWKDEPLNTALKRMLSLLNERAFVVDTGDDDADDLIFDDEIVGPPQLTLLYPLCKVILTSDKYGDAPKNDVLQLLQNALNRKFLKDGAVLHLPMEQYSSLLLGYYSVTLSAPALKALSQLMGLANDTGDVGPRVIGMLRETLAFVTNDRHEVRIAALQVLSAPQLLTRVVVESDDPEIVRDLLVRIYIAIFDPVEAVAEAANRVWHDNHFQPKILMGDMIVDECVAHSALVRESAARALFAYLEHFPDEMSKSLEKIDKLYQDLLEVRGAVFDDVGRLQRDAVDEFERRSGVPVALNHLATIVRADEAERLIHIVVPKGIVDGNSECRNGMRNAAVEAIRRHGAVNMGSLLPFLEKLSDSTPSGGEHDNMRQGLVVLLGTLAQYIDPTNGKVKSIVARLMDALSTPSQTVQESVSKCLSPLVPAIRSEVRSLILNLQNVLFEAETYGERRGAAYGIAGLVKGLGMASIKDIDLLPTIHKNLADKKSARHREGGLLALEILCTTIGKLFEPYIVKALPALLLCFGDNDENVRKSAEDTARAMMASMSVYGTKLILPSLLSAIDDESWRTKCAATELLGSMAFCAPRQLSSCLPSIVPKLIDVLADSSSKVQKSGEKALRQIARVVRNPEIIGVTNQLMAGMLDPANKTSSALQAVLNTKFIHYIDAPSLALMMPIVRRAFEDRNSETRRVAAQIIANIYSLTENKDMEPYLLNLVPGLQRSLLDPVPDIRTVSARALGAIVSKAGEKTSEQLRSDIVPWLKEKLVSPVSTVDRSGAAQGLCEVLAGVGTDQLDYVMPEIIAATESTEVSAETRDGYILMYIYLPMVFGDRFIPYLPQVVPPILKALADENEYVRASALKAGQRLISQYCSHARKLLLPQLQIALMDENWRIRYASVQLIGDFLFNISGISGKSTSATADDDDTMGLEQAGKTIVRALGQRDRDRVLAGLYLARSDVALVVRQAAGHVWKMIVANTPRTLKEVMKILFEMVVDSLASTCEERQQMGARCLGELVRKMGDKVIGEILPVLDANQKSEEKQQRVGVALALHEIIGNMSKEVLNHYLIAIVAPIRQSICDEDESVREAAANTFSVLYHVVGNEALDEIITPLLEKLTPDQDHILQGLCEVMKQNSRSMLPYLLPKLTKPPVNVHALCSLAAVSGDSLSRQLPKVLDALLASCETNEENDPMIESCEIVVTAVTDEEGVPVLIDYLLKRAMKGNVPAVVLLRTFLEKSANSLIELADEILPGLLNLYSSDSEQIANHAVAACNGMFKAIGHKNLLGSLPVMKKAFNALAATVKRGKKVHGLENKDGVMPFAMVAREVIINVKTESLREQAAETLKMIVEATNPEILNIHAVYLLGVFVRAVAEKTSNVHIRYFCLDATANFVSKVGDKCRLFVAQLTKAFLVGLQDLESRNIRIVAGTGLAHVSKIDVGPKNDVNIAELTRFLSSATDPALLETAFPAIRAMISLAYPLLKKELVEEAAAVAETFFSKPIETPSEMDNNLTMGSGALLGEIVVRMKDWKKAQQILADVESPKTKPRIRFAKTVALQQMCQSGGKDLWESEANSACRTALLSAFTSTEVVVASAAVRAAAFLIMSMDSPDRDLLVALAKTMNHSSVDVRRCVAVALGHIVEQKPLKNDFLKLIVPQLVNGSKETNSAVRSSSELALVHAFRYTEGTEGFEAYRSTVEPVVQKILDEMQPTFGRVVRSGDLVQEQLNNLLTVA
ncbi:unnamed protein product [Caenorhabditis auriculariae]|uniref:TOG domain-containing protein n=1 Tax=Caenorhabditis auriculariae TaxID=2777116 RepID=A0A8S1GWS7_9PELO|nr:unnamed protein product [Caenorhabditis auriculariae]